MELNEILEAIQMLSDEDKAKVQSILADTTTEEPTAKPDNATDDVDAEDSVNDTESGNDGAVNDEDSIDDEGDVADEGNKADESANTEGIMEEPIPDMESGSHNVTETAPPLQDEQGDELPFDYQQVIDGLNAKNLALESENKQLKAKIEGAFGLSSKPGAFAPINSLYGDISDIPQMRK